MRKIFVLCSALCSPTVLAVDADFSKSFVISETSGINNISIGGIDAVGSSYSVDFNLRENLTLSITDAVIQNSASEVLEQSLRNTTWQGTYVINADNYRTTLNLEVVQNGYVGGEIVHSESVQEGNALLHVRVTGDIVTQFEIGGSFVDEDRIDVDTLNSLSENTPNRQLIRVKRMRTLKFRTDPDDGSWQTNREYRLVLENGVLSGTVGIPNDRIGSNDDISSNGTISLTQQ